MIDNTETLVSAVKVLKAAGIDIDAIENDTVNISLYIRIYDLESINEIIKTSVNALTEAGIGIKNLDSFHKTQRNVKLLHIGIVSLDRVIDGETDMKVNIL